MNQKFLRSFIPACIVAVLAACGTPTANTSPSTPAATLDPTSTAALDPTSTAAAGPSVAASPSATAAAGYPAEATAASPGASNNIVSIPEIGGTPALQSSVSPLPAPDLQFSGERAFAHVEAQMQYVPRYTGTPGWQATGDYIIAQLQAAGWTVEEQRFPYNNGEGRNIIAKRGTGPLLIVGAHYDTRIYANEDPDPARRQDPVPGANDGASGVAVLLELAQYINTDQLGREVWLTFFDAEDNGNINNLDWIVGSTYLAENLPRQPEAMILADMIGDADQQIYYEQTSTPWLRESIWQTAAELGYRQFVPQPKYSVLDDHTPFLRRGIPAVDLIDFDYPYWHTVAETTDKVSAASLEAVGRTLERWLETRQRATQ